MPAVIEVPGSFELVVGCLSAARTGRFEGVVALGCIIRGETHHDRVIADAVATGLVQVSLATGVPVGFGVLTVDSARQARARAGGAKGNKGAEAMAAVLDTIRSLRALRDGAPAALPARADKTRGNGR
jgi:6,7-dimethyl-8-ribityllumazine synthase